MNKDLYYALLTGWVILVSFWTFIVVFIYVRKPPKSKLSIKILFYSYGLFLLGLILLIFFGTAIRF